MAEEENLNLNVQEQHFVAAAGESPLEQKASVVEPEETWEKAVLD